VSQSNTPASNASTYYSGQIAGAGGNSRIGNAQPVVRHDGISSATQTYDQGQRIPRQLDSNSFSHGTSRLSSNQEQTEQGRYPISNDNDLYQQLLALPEPQIMWQNTGLQQLYQATNNAAVQSNHNDEADNDNASPNKNL
jgi:hypothetical protein